MADVADEFLNYEVIAKSAIPPAPARHRPYNGQWLALARLIRDRLLPQEAVVLRLGTLAYNSAVSSLHCAAKEVGVRLSTLHFGNELYIVRTAVTAPQSRWGKRRREEPCVYCGEVYCTTRPNQRTCGRDACRRKRVNMNRVASRARGKKSHNQEKRNTE